MAGQVIIVQLYVYSRSNLYSCTCTVDLIAYRPLSMSGVVELSSSSESDEGGSAVRTTAERQTSNNGDSTVHNTKPCQPQGMRICHESGFYPVRKGQTSKALWPLMLQIS